MTGGGCAVWLGGELWTGARDTIAERETLAAPVRNTASMARKMRSPVWKMRCLFGGTGRGTPAGAAMPGPVFRAAALAFRRAARRQMSTHRQIS